MSHADADPPTLPAGATLPAAWARTWADRPEAAVLIEPAGTHRTAADLDDASARRAGRLAATGLRPGDRVLLAAGSSIDVVLAHVACLRLGLVVVLCNPAYTEREVAHLARDSDPAAAIVDDPERGAWAAAALGRHLCVLDVALYLPDGPRPNLDAADPAAPAVLMYTSGTTGAPRGAVLSHANLLAGARSVVEAWHWTHRDRLVLALPLFHAHGLCVGVHGTLLSGASAVVLPRFDAEAVLDAIADHAATLFFGVPTMYARLVASPRAALLRRLRVCVSGSAPLPPDVFAAVEAVSGQRVLERYGMTETLMLASNPYHGERRPGSVGVPLPGVQMRLTGGDRGDVEVRGPAVFAGYWRNPAATAESMSSDGWFRTGDVGRLDADGYLHLVGRSRELIITGGYNVYPREVEDVLSAHPDVAEAAVVGLPSVDWGETVAALVVAGPGRTPVPDDILAFARLRLAAYKVPRHLMVVEALPRNALGKVLRGDLAARLSGGHPADAATSP